LGGNPNCLGEVSYDLSLDNLHLDLRCSEDLRFKLFSDMYDERDCLLLESYKLRLLLCLFRHLVCELDAGGARGELLIIFHLGDVKALGKGFGLETDVIQSKFFQDGSSVLLKQHDVGLHLISGQGFWGYCLCFASRCGRIKPCPLCGGGGLGRGSHVA
jgi:hypothetical protein